VPARVLGDRWRWLGRPAVLAAVGVLALNDHVFKHRVPGWRTGNLSDVAGVAVVGTLASDDRDRVIADALGGAIDRWHDPGDDGLAGVREPM
jgi:hypothetical protein